MSIVVGKEGERKEHDRGDVSAKRPRGKGDIMLEECGKKKKNRWGRTTLKGLVLSFDLGVWRNPKLKTKESTRWEEVGEKNVVMAIR